MRWAEPRPAPRRYAYGLVLAAVALGLLAPGWASRVLGPVLGLGLLLLGLAHGACDQYVVPATHPALARQPLRYWVVFVGSYLGLAGAVGLLWWWQPAGAVAFFFVLSAWHWGSGDAPAAAGSRGQWLAHSLLRGGLIFAVPLLAWPAETRTLTNGLLTLAGAAPVSAPAVGQLARGLGLGVLGGHLGLWVSYVAGGQPALARTDALEVLLLTTLLAVLPPVLAGSVYFVCWHSLPHMLRMNAVMGRPATGRGVALGRELGFFLRRAAPLLAVSVAALAALYRWAGAAGTPELISLALLVASVVTLPHALLVTLALDAARWRNQSAGPHPLAPSPMGRGD